jgi:hypothetical protein
MATLIPWLLAGCTRTPEKAHGSLAVLVYSTDKGCIRRSITRLYGAILASVWARYKVQPAAPVVFEAQEKHG